MSKSIKVTKKSRGRPATGRGAQIGERWHPTELAAIDAWIASSADKTITRAHAVRRLVALGLAKSAQPQKPQVLSTAKQGIARAAEMAARTIDSLPPEHVGKPGRRTRAKELAKITIEKMGDPTASPEERDQRRRRLTKGPLEFREDRIDLPKAKGR
jgi:hypothetical protein